ncbi:MAG: FHA domain-containing protein [Chromatiales bacterium]|nr:FHA domain-containing protein [Chromatiales bacterium]
MAAATDSQVVILFADVVGSTQLYESLGDARARETVQQCLAVMREATEQFGGSVIKTIGDEVMATFPLADQSLNAANQMQQRISNHPAFQGEGMHVHIRVGCHFGPVVADARDIYGAAVVTANRMTSQAKAGQILTTAGLVNQLGPEWRKLVRQIDVNTPRGQSDEVAVYEVLWQPEEATSMLPSLDVRMNAAPRRLRLRSNGVEVLVGAGGDSSVTLGRADENDLVVKGSLISRMHARIELSRGNRFVLVDESTNGTFVSEGDGEEHYVRRDSVFLEGSGRICLGRASVPGSSQEILFEVEDPSRDT